MAWTLHGGGGYPGGAAGLPAPSERVQRSLVLGFGLHTGV